LSVLHKPRLLALAFALAALAFSSAAQARAGSFEAHPPKAVLMKGATVLQRGMLGTNCWGYWAGAGRGWRGRCIDAASYYFPTADVVAPGARLHVRLAKPERLSRLIFNAYPGVRYADPNRPASGKLFEGQSQPLKHTFERVKRDGKTVAWNVFFRVNEPDRDYYLDFYAVWKEVPGTHISSGDADYTFHVKTR
jgi:hypothetical protein